MVAMLLKILIYIKFIVLNFLTEKNPKNERKKNHSVIKSHTTEYRYLFMSCPGQIVSLLL